MDSGKNAVATLAHAGMVEQLVGQVDGQQGVGDPEKFTHPGCGDTSVDHAVIVADANDSVVANPIIKGELFEGGKYSIVVGSERFSGQELGVHGAGFLSALQYAMKYLAKGTVAEGVAA